MYRFPLLALLLIYFSMSVSAQTLHEIPARSLPVPPTVSPQMQKLIAAPPKKDWNIAPGTGEAWKSIADANAKFGKKTSAVLAARMRVKIKKSTINGVRVYIVTPDVIAPQNRDRVLINMHGGCYVLNPREAGLPEAVMMAGFGGFKVVAVDYRMPPEAYFPAAIDDGMIVWKELLKTIKPENIGIFGTSAGGALTLAMILQAKTENMAMPGAIAVGTPMSDVTKTGDSFYTNEKVDNVLVSRDGFCDAGTKVYANGHDLNDPMLSPVYGDMRRFPPVILTTGTRDLLLSNTIRVHRKLRQAGVKAELQVYEGQSHAHYLMDDTAPEAKEAFMEIAIFFEDNMGKPKSQ